MKKLVIIVGLTLVALAYTKPSQASGVYCDEVYSYGVTARDINPDDCFETGKILPPIEEKYSTLYLCNKQGEVIGKAEDNIVIYFDDNYDYWNYCNSNLVSQSPHTPIRYNNPVVIKAGTSSFIGGFGFINIGGSTSRNVNFTIINEIININTTNNIKIINKYYNKEYTPFPSIPIPSGLFLMGSVLALFGIKKFL